MSTRQLAEKFVREQLEIMKRYGTKVHMSPGQRREFVSSVKKTFDGMQAPSRTRRLA
jgi:hypothetical protein